MLPPTPALKDLTRFVAFPMARQALVSSGYGQQGESLPGVSQTHSIAPKQPPPGSVAAPLTSQAGPLANPLAQMPSTAALAASPRNATAVPSKSSKPELSPSAPITTIADPADGTDPYIVAEAQALGNSDTQIFAFVGDPVGFDVYAGSLRGSNSTTKSTTKRRRCSAQATKGAFNEKRF